MKVKSRLKRQMSRISQKKFITRRIAMIISAMIVLVMILFLSGEQTRAYTQITQTVNGYTYNFLVESDYVKFETINNDIKISLTNDYAYWYPGSSYFNKRECRCGEQEWIATSHEVDVASGSYPNETARKNLTQYRADRYASKIVESYKCSKCSNQTFKIYIFCTRLYSTATFASNNENYGTVSDKNRYFRYETDVEANNKTSEIKATAKEGYVFRYWRNNNDDTEIKKDTLTMNEVAASMKGYTNYYPQEISNCKDVTWTAYFEPDTKVEISYESADDTMGSVDGTVSSVWKETGALATGSEATAKTGYEFVEWKTSDGKVVSDKATLGVEDINKFAKDDSGHYKETTFIAYFKENQATITYAVADDQSQMGSIQLDGKVFPSDTLGVVTGEPKLPTAVANRGYIFKEWQKAGSRIFGTAKIDKAIIDSNAKDGNHHYTDTTLTAVFDELKETITYEVQGGNGKIKMTNAQGTEESGTTLTEANLPAATGSAIGEVSIVPDAGYELDSWTVGGKTLTVASDGKLTKALVDANAKDAGIYKTTTFVVKFKEKAAVTIQYKVDDATMGQVTDPADASKTDTLTSESVKPATEHAKGSTAKPATGYEFVEWTVNIDSNWKYTGDVLDVTEIENIARKSGAYDAGTNSAIVFTAKFKEKKNVDLKFTASSGGTLAGTLTQSVEPVTGDGKVSAVTATATTGYHFVNWTNTQTDEIITADEANAKTHTLTAEKIKSIAKSTGEYLETTFTANFAQDGNVTLTYTSDAHGEVVKFADGTNVQSLPPADGVAVPVTVKARTGYRFDKWTVDINSGWKLDYTSSSDGVLSVENIEAAAKKAGGDGKSAFVDAVFTAHFAEKDDIIITYKVADADTAKGQLTSNTETIAPVSDEAAGSTAVPEVGYELDGWYDETGECVSTDEHFAPERDADGLNVAATYEARFRRYTSQIDMGSSGSVLEIISTLTGDVPSSYSESFSYSVVAGADSPAITGDFETDAFTSVGSKYLSDMSMTVDDTYADATITISQNVGTTTNVVYDKSEYIVTYNIVRNDKKYEMTDIVIKKTKDSEGATISEEVSSIEFVNNYTAPKLVVLKEADKTYVHVGDLIIYTIKVTNSGDVAATGATITDTIGEGLEYVESSPAGAFDTPTLTWSDQTIEAGETKEYTVTVRVTDAIGDQLPSGQTTVQDGSSDASGSSSADVSAVPVIKLPSQSVAYSALWQRVTPATESSERDGVYGFIRGNLVEYEVTITNDSTLTLTMDVEDSLVDDGIFSDREIKSVTGATRNYDLESGVNITIAAGETAVIRFAANVQANIDEYDSEKFGDAGHVNEVVISGVVAEATLADGTTISYSRDGSVGTQWTGGGDPLADTTVTGTIPTREVDDTVTYSFDINWADTVPTYRPASIKVALVRADTGETIEEKTLTAENRTSSDVWSTTFKAWPVYDNAEISEISLLSEVSMLDVLLAKSHAVVAVDSDAVDSDVVDSDIADITADETIEQAEVATPSSATASEASDADEVHEDGTLIDGTVLDDTEVYDSRLHDVVAARRYILASLVSGLEDGEDRGEPIEYTVEILSEIPDGYTMSEVTSTGEKFAVTLSRPWTPREISTSGVPTKSGSSSGSSSSGSGSSGSSSSSGSGSSGTGSSTGEVGPGVGLSSTGSTTSGTGTSTTQVGPGVGLSSGTGSSTGSGSSSTSWGSTTTAQALTSSLQTSAGTGSTSGTAATGTAGSEGTTTGTAGLADALAGVGPARTSTYIFIAGEDGLWQAHATSTADASTGADLATGETTTADTTAATAETLVTTEKTAQISSIAGLGDVEFELTDSRLLTNQWALIGTVQQAESETAVTYEWYHFGDTGNVDIGWFTDETGNWYYLSENEDGSLGSMSVGWQYNTEDGRWYYLDSTTGAMVTGWQEIDGAWYYFTTGTPIETWEYNTLTRKWVYKHLEDDRPLGSLYIDETTPDGYVVGTSGAVEN